MAVEIRLERTNWALDPQTRLGAPGGFGEVFDGLSGTGEAVAIKRLRLEASEAAHREFRVASELIDRELRHVMPVLDYGLDSESDRYFLVMPRAQGSLADHLGASGILPEPEVVSILSEICVGLGEVPELVHRDLKPANILRHEDRWKIADFGIAKFVEEATSERTLRDCLSEQYAAPEQWRFESCSPATDLYAIGCIAFALLSGKPPFAAESNLSEAHQFQAPPELPQGSGRLRALVGQLLRKSPLARPSRARLQAQLSATQQEPKGGEGANKLAQAVAKEQAAFQRREAQALAGERVAEQRRQLLAEARNSLVLVIDQVEAVLQATGVEGIDRLQPESLLATLGNSLLSVGPGHPFLHPVPVGLMRRSGWDLICHGSIEVQGRLIRNADAVVKVQRRAASLWYVDMSGSQGYRWYECSYCDDPEEVSRPRGEVFVLGPEQADLVHAGHETRFSVAFGPVPIDDEDASAFSDRWSNFLADAYGASPR